MGISLLHEIAHTLGLGEVYGEEHDLAQDFGCVMERYEDNIGRKPVDFYQNIISGNSPAFCGNYENAILNILVDP